jgi:hypothetical protein
MESRFKLGEYGSAGCAAELDWPKADAAPNKNTHSDSETSFIAVRLDNRKKVRSAAILE